MKPKAARPSNLRFEILNAFIDVSMRTLTSAEVRVWMTLYREVKPPDGNATASLDVIAHRAGVHRQTAYRAVRSLESRSMLRVVKRGGPNAGPTTYRLAPYPMDCKPGD